MSNGKSLNKWDFLFYIFSIVALTVVYSVVDMYEVIDKLGYALFTVQSILYLWKEANEILNK